MNGTQLLDRLDRLYPNIPPAAERPYGWEEFDDPNEAMQWVQGREANVTDLLLSFWENQSGGQGWQWRLFFPTLRELVDFAILMPAAFHCDGSEFDDVDLGEDTPPPGSDTREALLTAPPRRKDGTLDLEAVCDELGDILGGELEWIATIDDLLHGDTNHAREFRSEFRDDGSDDPIDDGERGDFLRSLFPVW